MPTSQKQRLFKLLAGHPALDLVNTLDWRFRETGKEELLASYEDLTGFLAQSNLISGRAQVSSVRNVSNQEAENSLVACRAVREAAAAVLYAVLDKATVPPAAKVMLENVFREARERQRLNFSEGRFRWEWWATPTGQELPLLVIGESVRSLLLTDDVLRLRACENDECRWLFLDTSRNHTRRWCDMKLCGNRLKVRRFKALRRG